MSSTPAAAAASRAPAPATKVAVVGTGIAGLACAHILASAGLDVSVFESKETLGMDSASISFDGARMDVPLRTFSVDYYPNLARLYHAIGLNFSTANYQFSLAKQEEGVYFSYYNFYRNELLRRVFGFELVSFPVLVSWNPLKLAKYAKLLVEMYRFQKRGPRDLNSGRCANLTFKQYVLGHFSADFYYELLLPMLSVICTCTWDAVGEYPAEVLVDYMAGRSRQHPMGSTTMRCTDGTVEIVRKLSGQCRAIHTSCYVRSVQPGTRPVVRWSCATATGEKPEEKEEVFDHVIVATQANAARFLLPSDVSSRTSSLLDILAQVKYEKNRTVLHHEPINNASSSSTSFPGTCHLQVDLANQRSDCTIWMNRIDPLLAGQLETSNVFQTWNPFLTEQDYQEDETKQVLLDVQFERPVMTLQSMRVLDELAQRQGEGGVWFVGAYSLYSMPLLENGVRSAIRVANRLLPASQQYPEFGVQLSGDAFAQRRPDLVAHAWQQQKIQEKQQETTIKHQEERFAISRKTSFASLALDSLVWGTALLVLGGSAMVVSQGVSLTTNSSTGGFTRSNSWLGATL